MYVNDVNGTGLLLITSILLCFMFKFEQKALFDVHELHKGTFYRRNIFLFKTKMK